MTCTSTSHNQEVTQRHSRTEIHATTIGCTDKVVLVHDTAYYAVDKMTKELILKMFGVQQLKMEKAPKHPEDGRDCGVFAMLLQLLCTLWISWCNGLYLFHSVWHVRSCTSVL